MSEWRPIDTAPKARGIIVAVPNEHHSTGYIVGEAYFWDADECSAHEVGWWWAGTGPGDYHADKFYGATHWMPLPTPPVVDHQSACEASAASSKADGPIIPSSRRTYWPGTMPRQRT